MSVTIRTFDFSETDYETAASIHNAVYSAYPETSGEIRWGDENRDPKIKWARFFAEAEGEPVALGYYGQSSAMYHPRKFYVDVNVLPEWRGKGIGTQVYEHLHAELTPHDPLAFFTEAREDDEPRLRVLARLGFTEDMREWESRFDPTGFDPTEYQKDLDRVAEQGIVIKSFADLMADDPEAPRKLHALHVAVVKDIPHPDEVTAIPFEVWSKRFSSPNHLNEANFVALDGDRYIGTSVLYRNLSNDILDTGMTGTLREYRKRGIATAMKVHALSFARARGASAVRTWNERNNEGMLGINIRLGFVRQPAWMSMRKTLKTEE